MPEAQRDLFEATDPQQARRVKATQRQLEDLLGALPPSQRHRPTSVAAAHNIRAKARNYRVAVLAMVLLRGSNGATAYEVEEALQLRASTASARCNELMRYGFIEDSGRTRDTVTGNPAIVWVATRKARAVVAQEAT